MHYSVDPAEDHVRLGADDARSICRKHGFSPYKKEQRKVYDLILLSSELDWLEIRLRTLSPFVDYFVVVESHKTFTGETKPLHLQDGWDLFRDHHHKIIHRVVYDPIKSDDIWDHEEWFSNSMLTQVFPGLVGTQYEAHDGDVLVVSDMDEIVRPGAMLLLRHCDIPERLSMGTDAYSYSFQWRRRGPQWTHPDATIYRGEDTLLPNELRQGSKEGSWGPSAVLRKWRSRATLWDAGWHCSGCFPTIAEMRTMMNGYSHKDVNTPENRDAKTIIDRVRNGKDLFGRPNEIYDRVEHIEDVPEFILSQNRLMMRFKYLLERNGEDAGFEDWESAPRND